MMKPHSLTQQTSHEASLPPHLLGPNAALAHKLISLIDTCLVVPEALNALESLLDRDGGAESLRERVQALGADNSPEGTTELLRTSKLLAFVAKAHLWKAHLVELPWGKHSGGTAWASNDTRTIIIASIRNTAGSAEPVFYDLTNKRGFKASGRLDGTYLSPDGKKAFAALRADPPRKPYLIDLNTGDLIRIPCRYLSEIDSLSFCEKTGSTFARIVVSGSRQILNLESGEVLGVAGFKIEDSDYPTHSPDGTEMFAPFKFNGSWYFVEMNSKKMSAINSTQAITALDSVRFSHDGRLAYSRISYTLTSSICDVRTGRILTVGETEIYKADAPFFLKDIPGGMAWVCTRNDTEEAFHLLNLEAQTIRSLRLSEGTSRINCVAFTNVSPDGARAYSGIRSANGRIDIVDIRVGTALSFNGRVIADIPQWTVFYGPKYTPFAWIKFDAGWELANLETQTTITLPGVWIDRAHMVDMRLTPSQELVASIQEASGMQSIVKLTDGKLEVVCRGATGAQLNTFTATNGCVYAVETVKGEAQRIINIQSGESISLPLSNQYTMKQKLLVSGADSSIVTLIQRGDDRPDALLELFGSSFLEQKRAGIQWTFKEVPTPPAP